MDYSHLSVPGKSRRLVVYRVMRGPDMSVTVYFIDVDAPDQEPIILRVSPTDITTLASDLSTVYSTGVEETKTLDPALDSKIPQHRRR